MKQAPGKQRHPWIAGSLMAGLLVLSGCDGIGTEERALGCEHSHAEEQTYETKAGAITCDPVIDVFPVNGPVNVGYDFSLSESFIAKKMNKLHPPAPIISRIICPNHHK